MRCFLVFHAWLLIIKEARGVADGVGRDAASTGSGRVSVTPLSPGQPDVQTASILSGWEERTARPTNPRRPSGSGPGKLPLLRPQKSVLCRGAHVISGPSKSAAHALL